MAGAGRHLSWSARHRPNGIPPRRRRRSRCVRARNSRASWGRRRGSTRCRHRHRRYRPSRLRTAGRATLTTSSGFFRALMVHASAQRRLGRETEDVADDRPGRHRVCGRHAALLTTAGGPKGAVAVRVAVAADAARSRSAADRPIRRYQRHHFPRCRSFHRARLLRRRRHRVLPSLHHRRCSRSRCHCHRRRPGTCCWSVGDTRSRGRGHRHCCSPPAPSSP